MSSFAEKYNKQGIFGVSTANLPYVKLETLFNENGAEKVYTLQAIYINTRSKFGDAPVAVIENAIVNLPSHMLKQAKDILADNEAIDAIKSGLAGFTVYSYPSHGKTCYSIKFVDIE